MANQFRTPRQRLTCTDLNHYVWQVRLESIVAQVVGTTALWIHLLPNQNRLKMAIFIGLSPSPLLSLRDLVKLRLPPLLRPLRTLSLPLLPSLLLLRSVLLLGLRILTHPRKLQQGVLETPLPQMRRMLLQREKGWPTNPTPNRTNLNPQCTKPSDVGEVVGGLIDHNCSCHFLLFFASSSLMSHVLYSFVSSTHLLDVLFYLHFCIPISCKIVFHAPYPLTLASGILYSILRIVLLVICAYYVSTRVDVRRLRQGIHKVAFLAYRSHGSE